MTGVLSSVVRACCSDRFLHSYLSCVSDGINFVKDSQNPEMRYLSALEDHAWIVHPQCGRSDVSLESRILAYVSNKKVLWIGRIIFRTGRTWNLIARENSFMLAT